MSNTKIAIDKEDFEQKIIGWIERRNYVTKSDILALFQDLTTEIQIDQSIEDAAKEYLNKNCLIGTRFKKVIYEVSSFDLLEFSKQQQIIEQLRVKEKVCDCEVKGAYEESIVHICRNCDKEQI